MLMCMLMIADGDYTHFGIPCVGLRPSQLETFWEILTNKSCFVHRYILGSAAETTKFRGATHSLSLLCVSGGTLTRYF